MNDNRKITFTRRDLLHGMLAGTAGLAVGRALPGLAQAAPPATRPAAKLGKARAAIEIWLWGGPAHMDTFDPKPDSGYDYTGPLNKPIDTNVPGIRIGQLLPELAKRADKYSIIRGMTHGNNGHETASYIVQTGRQPGGMVYPCVGAVVSLFKGYDRGYKGLIPPYIVLTSGRGRFSEVGFLGPRYKPFITGGDPKQKVFAVEGIVSESITGQQQKDRREMLHKLDSLGKAVPNDPRLRDHEQSEDKAYGMILGDGAKLFDLSQEKDDLRDRYGRTTFGQSCLAARRLVEYGVPYITINYKGWDTHKQHFQIMNTKLPELDKGLATLLQDLSDRGLLDSTVVFCTGEFGRTPKVMWEAPWNGGRGHYGACFSAVVAGGGFKGGRVVGASDAKAVEVAERPVHPTELIRSIYAMLGIDSDAPLPNGRGLDIRVMPLAEGFTGPGMLTEIM